MKHVSTIKKIIEAGQSEEALSAIDNLLELGPKNTEALKLKALIYASQGRLAEEAMVYNRVLTVDREDVEAIEYLLRQQNEDREHFYFSDPAPNGGRRYLAYPKKLFYTSIMGLFGCFSFFSLSKILSNYPEYGSSPTVLMGAFLALVMGPWLAIVWGWARTLKSVTVHPSGLIAETRFRKLIYPWQELTDVALAYGGNPYDPELCLVLRHKDQTVPPLYLDMSQDSSSLRAKSYLLKEIAAYYGPIRHAPIESLPASSVPPKKY